MILKINYSNSEDGEGYVVLDVNCPTSEYNDVVLLIKDFKKRKHFHTSAFCFVDELKRFGFQSKELKYDMEVY